MQQQSQHENRGAEGITAVSSDRAVRPGAARRPREAGEKLDLSVHERASLSRLCELLARAAVTKLARDGASTPVKRNTPAVRPVTFPLLEQRILHLVVEAKVITPGEIGVRLRSTRTPVRKALARLEAAGLIVLSGSTRDRVIRSAGAAGKVAA